jgi:hypothetical protein
VLLSRTPLDLVTGASHHTKNHPIETSQLSLPPCAMRVDLTKTARQEGTACGAMVRRLYSGRECGPEALDCSPRRMIAVSGAVNVVLSRAIEADNVVSETR